MGQALGKVGVNYKARPKSTSSLDSPSSHLEFSLQDGPVHPRVPRRRLASPRSFALGHGHGRVFAQQAMKAKLLERQGTASAHRLLAASPTANAEGALRVPTPSLHEPGPEGPCGAARCCALWEVVPARERAFSPTAAASKRGNASDTHLSQFRSGSPCMSDRQQDNHKCGLNKAHRQEPGWSASHRCASHSLGIWAEHTWLPGWPRLCSPCFLARIFISSPCPINMTLDREPPSVGVALRAPDFSASFSHFQSSGSDNSSLAPKDISRRRRPRALRDRAEQNDTSRTQHRLIQWSRTQGPNRSPSPHRRGHNGTTEEDGTIYRVGGPLVANRFMFGTNQTAQVSSSPACSGAGQPENIASGTVQSDTSALPRPGLCFHSGAPVFSVSPPASSLHATASRLAHTLLDTRAEERNNTTLASPCCTLLVIGIASNFQHGMSGFLRAAVRCGVEIKECAARCGGQLSRHHQR